MHEKVNRTARAWTNRRNYINGSPPRVLVVDDNRDAAEAMATFLQCEDMEARTEFGGLDAIALAHQWVPDVILMDISMPACNGFEAARALRADARTRDIAIIAFTALDESEVRRHLADHEFDGYAQKGQSATALVELIWTFLEKAEWRCRAYSLAHCGCHSPSFMSSGASRRHAIRWTSTRFSIIRAESAAEDRNKIVTVLGLRGMFISRSRFVFCCMSGRTLLQCP
jgi:CheY-like chemotaxis protein